MKHAKYWIGLLGLAAMVAGWAPQAHALTETVDGVTWTYSVLGDVAMVSRANPTKGSITIPSVLGGCPVACIRKDAFTGCTQLTSLTIPDSVKSIGSRAFDGCINLTSIGIGGGLANVGEGAFARCAKLTKVHIHNLAAWCGISFENESSNPLYYANHLYLNGKEITGELELPASVKNLGDNAFASCSNLTSVTIGNGVTDIGDGTFSRCYGLTNVIIGNCVTSIGMRAFFGCEKLADVAIPSGVRNIGEEAFSYCRGLTNMTISDSVTCIGERAFGDCSRLNWISVNEGNPAYASEEGVLFTRDKRVIVHCPRREQGMYAIPDGVKSIGNYAFYRCPGLTNVLIPDSVTEIGEGAFWETFLQSRPEVEVAIPDSVTTIGEHAFYRCYGLRTVLIPESVTNIGETAFMSCGNVTNVTILGDYVCPFFGCTNIETVTLGGKMTKIGDYMFSGCTVLRDITIPDSVTNIGKSAFRDCRGLTNVALPDNVTSIEDYSFSGCSGLTGVAIPDSVTSIGRDAFQNCDALFDTTSVSGVRLVDGWAIGVTNPLPVAVGLTDVPGIASGAFDACTTLTSVTVSSSVRDIGSRVFSGCENLASFQVAQDNPAYASKDGVLFSKDMKTLVRVPPRKTGFFAIPDSVTNVGNFAFEGCTNLTSVMIPDSVTGIGEGAFSNCDGLTDLIIPPSVTNIGKGAFANCDGLRAMTIPDGVTGIAPELFQFCELTSITIPDSVTNIGEYAFYCCDMTNVAIPDSVTSIDEGAFYQCIYLSDVRIPGSVTRIGESAFSQCYMRLTNVTIDNGVTSIGNRAFWKCSKLMEVTIPNSVTNIGNYAFEDCTNLMSVTIPDSVTSIGEGAFSGCNGLKLYVPTSWEKIPGWGVETLPLECEVIYCVPIDVDGSCSLARSGNEWRFHVANGCAMLTSVESDAGVLMVPSGFCVSGSGRISVVRIADEAFSGCGKLTTVAIPGSVESISRNAFSGCTSLKRILLPVEWAGSGKLDDVRLPAGCEVVYGVHSGTLASSQTWTAEMVHVVDGNLTVESGAMLTIEPGAVVKFLDKSSLTVASGGACVARGVVFTHIADDTVGGDTMMDSEASAPTMGAYAISGTVTDDDATEYRYLPPQVLPSWISSNMRLKGYRTYIASNSVTVANGATLTLQPGTILKFASSCQLTVNGTLDAKGTRAAPIVFTSLKDDEHGGDSNGDGDKSSPQPGDWARIYAGGTLNMDHCRIRYCNNNSDYGAIHGTGGTVRFDNSVIEFSVYECVRMNSGKFTARNSVFRESSMGFGYYGGSGVYVYNGVVADCTIACRASNKHFYNTVFYRCKTFLESTSSSCDHCVFFNPMGYGAQSASQVGNNANVWGDPLFAASDNGDFRIVSAASPCVDAADTTQAPEMDFYGQGRLTVRYSPTGTPDALGRHADIGLHEYLPENEAGIYDLAAKSVSATAANAVPGQKLAISWTVANAGKRMVPDSWHDALALVSVATGKVYPFGEALNPGVLDAGEERNFTDFFAVPVVPEGSYRLRLTVNSRRSEVPEGAATANNSILSGGEISIAIPATASTAGATGKVAAGASAAVAFSVPAGVGDLLLRVSAPAGGSALSARVGLGHLPADAASGTALVFADGEAWFMVPAGTETVWLVLDNGGTAEVGYTADFRAGSLSLTSVTPVTLPASGKVTLQLTGAGFTDGCRVTVGGVSASAVRCVGESLLSATIDCAKLAAGSKPAVTVAKGAETKTLANAITVSSVAGEGKFFAKLSVPESVREGRLVQTCAIEYGNSGTADLASPVLQVSMTGNGTLGYIGGLQGQKTLQFVAAGDAGSAGILRPGETHRIRFALRAGSSNKISLHSSIGSTYAPAPWTSAATYLADLSAAATRIGLRGQDATDYADVFDLARAMRNGEPTSAIHGRVVDADGAGVAGVLVSFTDEDTDIRSDAVSDSNGHFCTTNLPSGTFFVDTPNVRILHDFDEVAVDGANDYGTGDIAVDNRLNFKATILGGEGEISVVAWKIKDGNIAASATLDESGNAVFLGLEDGLYVVQGLDTNGVIRSATVFVSAGRADDATLDFAGNCSLRVKAIGLENPVECLAAIFCNGDLERTLAFDADGEIRADNLPPGDCLVVVGRGDSENTIGATASLSNGEFGDIEIDATGRFALAASTTSANPVLSSGDIRHAVASGLSNLYPTGSLEKNCQILLDEANAMLATPVLPPLDIYNCEHNQRKYRTTLQYFKEHRLEALRFFAVLSQYRAAKAKKWARVWLVGPMTAEMIADAYFRPGGGVVTSLIDKLLKGYVDGDLDPTAGEDLIADCGLGIVDTLKKEGIYLEGWGTLGVAEGKLKTILSSVIQFGNIGRAWKSELDAETVLEGAYKKFHTKMFAFNFHYPRYDGVNGNYSHLCDKYVVEEMLPTIDIVTPSVPQSCDPNEMAGPEGTGADRTLLAGETYEWTIYFENKTNATAAAAEVRVTERLSPQLDWKSFEMVEVSFGETTDIGLAGKANGTSETNLAGTNWTVRTEVALDATNGVVEWYLRVVDPEGDEDGWPLDPTAGFLPPNDETHRGEGHITYRVKVKGNATENARIDAAATIVFDNNDPIPTDPAWWNTVAWRSFAVKFNANGGNGSMANQRIQRNAPTKLSANKFTRSGHTFIGWSKSKTGKVEYANAASVKNLAAAGGSVTLYAQWAKNAYKVAFNANGGTGKMAAQAMTYGKAAKLRNNAFTRKDCVFIGWAKTKGGAVAYGNQQAVKNLRTDGGTTTLHAKWAKTKYAVAFNANGGKGSMKTQAMTYNKAAKLGKNAFTRSGWTFLGWSKTKTGAVAYKNAQAVKNLRTDGKTTTLYAVWAKNAYKVAFKANGGTGSMAVQGMTYGKAANLRKNAFKRTGYTFSGWAKTATGAVAYKNAQAVKNLRTDGGTTTLYAKWTATTYKVAFNANGGTGTMAAQSVKYDTAAKLAANAFQRDGFTFGGWAKSADGAVAYGDQASVKNLRSDGGTVMLYAVWAPNPAAETTSTPVAVPYGWLDGKAASILAANGSDYEAAAKTKAANGVNTVWECYVAGLDPEDKAAEFKVTASFENGEWTMVPDPDLNKGGAETNRIYTWEGAEELGDEAVWGPTNAASRFFRVKVALPEE